MSTRLRLVAGNWKLNGTRESAVALARAVAAGFTGADAPACRALVCPPFVHLEPVREALSGSPVTFGAQNASEHDSGAFTGEVAASMLAEAGCDHVIVGHSERRALFGETSEQVARKAQAVQAAGMVPILCVGETLEEREGGRVEEVVGEQLDAVLDTSSRASGADPAAGFSLERLVVAYEPVWAIGTGKTASPDEAQAVHAIIRERVAGRNSGVAAKLLILYGGSVKPDNAATLFARPDIDGGLIGGAALDADAFLSICRAGT